MKTGEFLAQYGTTEGSLVVVINSAHARLSVAGSGKFSIVRVVGTRNV